MTLVAPFTRDDIFRGVYKINPLEANETRVRTKPRASSLAGDAREIAYMMSGLEPTDPQVSRPDRIDGGYTAEQGRRAEDLTIEALHAERSDIRIVGRQVCIGHPACKNADGTLGEQGPLDHWASGHPDGEIEFKAAGQWLDREPNTPNLKWGFEHKMLGRFQIRKILTEGLLLGFPEVILQSLVYGSALGWDAVSIAIGAQDASSIKVERYRIKNEIENAHNKMMVFEVDLREYAGLVPMLKARADWFAEWAKNDGDPTHVKVEAKDDNVDYNAFPWGWSDYVTAAITDPPGTLEAPPVPLPRDWAK